MNSFHIKKFNKVKFVYGILFVLLGIALPSFLTVETFRIPEHLYLAIRSEDAVYLLMSGLGLVALNSLRAFPHYLGAFFIAESVEIRDSFPFEKLFKSALVCLIIPPVYGIIGVVHHVKYYFGVPAIVLLLLLILLGKSDYNRVSVWKKAMLIIVFLTAFQFVDIMPCMANLPVGKGETSKDVKLVATFIDATHALDIMALIFLMLLLCMGILLFLLIRDENNLREMNALKEKNRKMEIETQITALKNRTFLEMNSLVHDLKSPLTSAQALVGVVRSNCERDLRMKDANYLENVEMAIHRLSDMISEILYEDYRSDTSTSEIVQSVLAQISISSYANYVVLDNAIPEKKLDISKTRMTRVLINLIENAYDASSGLIAKGKLPKIQLDVNEVKRLDSTYICFSVSDNGIGIAPENIERIWEMGYSTRGSHGFGLGFVKGVVDAYHGTVEIKSTLHAGTTISILLEEGEAHGTDAENSVN
jgi:signal transduction histidine kinase